MEGVRVRGPWATLAEVAAVVGYSSNFAEVTGPICSVLVSFSSQILAYSAMTRFLFGFRPAVACPSMSPTPTKADS